MIFLNPALTLFAAMLEEDFRKIQNPERWRDHAVPKCIQALLFSGMKCQ